MDTLRVNPEIKHDSYSIIEEKVKKGYQQLLIRYQGFEQDDIYAYLLLPNGSGPFPAVMIHHQHNGEWYLGKSEVCGLKGDPLNAFGPEFARSGFIVLSADSVGFEDRRRIQRVGKEEDEETDWLQYYNGMAYRLVQDRFLITTVLNDAFIGIDLLTSLPQVNLNKIGIMGHSYGGSITIFHAAIDERVKFACASGAACSYKNKIQNETGLEMSLIVPGILDKFDIPELTICVSPRNILFVSSTDDIYSNDAKEISQYVHQELQKLDAIDKLEHKRFEGSHALTKERFDFIVEWVKNMANIL